jgi:hypothetical protein
MGWYPVAVVILHVYRMWHWLLIQNVTLIVLEKKNPLPLPRIESWFHGRPVRDLVRIRYSGFKLRTESSDYTSLNLVQDTLCVLTIENMMALQNLPGKTNVASVRSRESHIQEHMKAGNRKFHISRNHIFLYTSFLSSPSPLRGEGEYGPYSRQPAYW